LRDLKAGAAFDVSSVAARRRNVEIKRDSMIIVDEDLSIGIRYWCDVTRDWLHF